MLKYELQETFIIILLCIIPIAISCIKLKTYNKFKYKKLVTLINYSLKYGVIIYIALIAFLVVIQYFWIRTNIMKILYDIVCGYSAISFLYILIAIILNLPLLPRFIRIMTIIKKNQKK